MIILTKTTQSDKFITIKATNIPVSENVLPKRREIVK